jgi:hypothetical protein
MDIDINNQPYEEVAEPIIDIDDEDMITDQQDVNLDDSKDILARGAMEKRCDQIIHPFDLNTDPAHEQEQLIRGKLTSKKSFINVLYAKKNDSLEKHVSPLVHQFF